MPEGDARFVVLARAPSTVSANSLYKAAKLVRITYSACVPESPSIIEESSSVAVTAVAVHADSTISLWKRLLWRR